MEREKESRKERDRERETERSRGAEVGAKDGVVVREEVGAVDASGLDGMVRLCVEHRVYVVFVHHFISLLPSFLPLLVCFALLASLTFFFLFT